MAMVGYYFNAYHKANTMNAYTHPGLIIVSPRSTLTRKSLRRSDSSFFPPIQFANGNRPCHRIEYQIKCLFVVDLMLICLNIFVMACSISQDASLWIIYALWARFWKNAEITMGHVGSVLIKARSGTRTTIFTAIPEVWNASLVRTQHPLHLSRCCNSQGVALSSKSIKIITTKIQTNKKWG